MRMREAPTCMPPFCCASSLSMYATEFNFCTQFYCDALFHDLLLRSCLYYCAWNAITAIISLQRSMTIIIRPTLQRQFSFAGFC